LPSNSDDEPDDVLHQEAIGVVPREEDVFQDVANTVLLKTTIMKFSTFEAVESAFDNIHPHGHTTAV